MSVSIGCFSAFWGDTSTSFSQLLSLKTDYLIGDFLAEVTLALLTRGEGFIGEASRYTQGWQASQHKPVVIVNAGGTNVPALVKLIASQLPGESVAGVVGDTLSVEPLRAVYLGAEPIAAAIRAGAKWIITGRCVDSALALAPLLAEFSWPRDAWDARAAGSLVGHLLECGAQVTGGNFTDWREAGRGVGWAGIGFPIALVQEDGSAIVTKGHGTGGVVSVGTVAEQLLYEIGNPAAYQLPDVTCDWSGVTLTQVGVNRVRVSGARGYPPPATLKMSCIDPIGWCLAAWLVVPGFEAEAKARATAEAIFARVEAMTQQRFLATNVEIVGSATGPPPTRVALRLAASAPDPAILKVLAREIAPAATGMAPGLCAAGSGRPKPRPMLQHRAEFVPRSAVNVHVMFAHGSDEIPVGMEVPCTSEPRSLARAPIVPLPSLPRPLRSVPLRVLCYGRSGDKGDGANVGLIARSPALYPVVRGLVTEEFVRRVYATVMTTESDVTLYDLPGVHAINIVMTQVLGGGGLASLRMDSQGKGYAQWMLEQQVPVPVGLLPRM